MNEKDQFEKILVIAILIFILLSTVMVTKYLITIFGENYLATGIIAIFCYYIGNAKSYKKGYADGKEDRQ